MSDELAAIQEQTFATATKATADSYPPERRPAGHELAAYLDRCAFAVIGSCHPHAAISSYIRQGRQFWLSAVAGSVRERNAGTHPWLTMTITEGDRDHHVAVLVEGPAGVIAPVSVPAEVRAAVPCDWPAAWIRLTAERLLSYASKGTIL